MVYKPKGQAYEEPKEAVEGQEDEGQPLGYEKPYREHNYGHRSHKHDFHGKPREPYHPYDRRSGTGRGYEFRKEGHGRGNWGNEIETLKYGETVEPEEGNPGEEKQGEENQEFSGRDRPYRKDREYKDREYKGDRDFKGRGDRRGKREDVEEEEEGGMTMEEFMAKKKSVTGVKKPEVRQHGEEVKKANLEQANIEKEKVHTIDSKVKTQELYNVGATKGENAQYLAFNQGYEEDEYDGESRRGRGGRGRGGRGSRGGYRGGDDYRRGGRG